MVASVFAAVMPAMVSAVDPTGAAVDAGPTETYAGTSAETNASQGGYVTEINLSATTQTGKWQGYYGNITGGISLKDTGGASMFDWTATITGEVIATTNSSTPPWGNYNNHQRLDPSKILSAAAKDTFSTSANLFPIVSHEPYSVLTYSSISIFNSSKSPTPSF